MEKQRRAQIHRLYGLLEGLAMAQGGARLLGSATGRDRWPTHGVYFFFEPGEYREDGKSPRVVRVGTHALTASSRSRLWNRLRTHRGRIGGSNPGSGNHRASIFRGHVGFAIIDRDDYPEAAATWSAGSSAPRAFRELELRLERAVSGYIGAMHVLVLPVSDWKHRASIERGCIGLLSNYDREPIDPAGAEWLGRYARHAAVRHSGLWNVNHVDEAPSPITLELVETYVQ